MPKVNANRDQALAIQGYIRAAHIAILLNVSRASISRLLNQYTFDRIEMSGMVWVSWSHVRLWVNSFINGEGLGQADASLLPVKAIDALKLARNETNKQYT